MLNRKFLSSMILGLTCGGLVIMPSSYANEEMYDTDTKQYLVDTDRDGYPDITEQKGGTDINDPSSFPGSELLSQDENSVNY